MKELEGMVLKAYEERAIGLEVLEVALDCCITKAPCGGEKAGRSPVHRAKRAIKRSVAVDAGGIPIWGIPIWVLSAPANRHDSPPLGESLHAARAWGLLPRGASIRLDRGYNSEATRRRLCGFASSASADLREGQALPPERDGAMDRRERTNAWQNAHNNKLVWCTERRARVVDFWGWLSRTW